jgi:eukaryotic-like serine/threonine-protein kinase
MGEGGFRRPLVIKKLRPELVSDPVAVAQFCDEANLLAALHHANIVAVHDFSRTGDQYFLAEEYVLGRNLGQLLRRSAERRNRSTGLDGAAVGHVAVEVLKALDYAHNLTDEQGVSLGIVHRDVSPANVMISARAEVKLLDFGVVKTAGTRASNNEAGVAKGNVTYMSPEHARGADIDSRADLYSLALSLVFCLTGKPLYDAETTYGLLMKAAAGPGPEELAVVNSLPAPFARVLRRALAAHIGERHQTAREMAADLEPAAMGGSQRLAALVTELYGPELDGEARRLSTFSSTGTMVRRVGS